MEERDVEKTVFDEAEKRDDRQAHGHSRHSRHKHHHHHRKPSLKHKIKRYYRKNKKVLLPCGIVLSVVIVIGLISGAFYADTQNRTPQQQAAAPAATAAASDRTENKTQAPIYVGLPSSDQPHLLVHHLVSEYMEADPSVSLHDFMELNAAMEQSLDISVPVTLQFDFGLLMSDGTIRSAGVEVSENASFAAADYEPLDKDGKASFQHLKTGQTYHYRLTMKLQNGESTTVSGTFQTAESPRILSIDGIHNVRDIGGWKTTDGKRVRQGLLYRGTEIDGAVEPGYRLTPTGINEMTQVLGIRSDIDLRAETDAVPGSYIISQIRHTYYPVAMYQDIFADGQKETVRRLFSELSKPETYPAYLHCTYGMDRTGIVSYLLEAVLGLSDEDLLREYELSMLHHTDLTRAQILVFIEQLQTYPGETTQQKAESFLLSAGVTPAELSSIRNIFLENDL